jgi:hypothetical protein
MLKLRSNILPIILCISSLLMIANGLLIAQANAPIVLSSSRATSLAEIWSKAPLPQNSYWGRMVLGFPGYVENYWSYFWVVWAMCILACAVAIYRKPRRSRKLGIWIVAFSLLTMPIGGGFLIGATVAVIASLVAFEWPKPFNDTWMGGVLQAVTLRSKFFVKMTQNGSFRRGAVIVVIFTAILAGIGTSLYTVNLSRIYPIPSTLLIADSLHGSYIVNVNSTAGFDIGYFVTIGKGANWETRQIVSVGADYLEFDVPLAFDHAELKDEVTAQQKTSFDARAASEILLKGRVFVDETAWIASIAYIAVAMIKWLVLTAAVYVIGVKITGRTTTFDTMLRVAAFAFLPEALMYFLPFVFSNEPMLSVGSSSRFLPIPTSWPLLLYYASHLWGFAILTVGIEKALDVFRQRAVGIALFSGSLYWLTMNQVLTPILNAPGFGIRFATESSLGVLAAISVLLLLAVLLGTFKKE